MKKNTYLISGPLQTERLDNGKRRLLRDLSVSVDTEVITVPKGFITNFSSIPSFASPIVHWSKVEIAGVVHDYLYFVQPNKITRWEADKIWYLVAVAGEHRASTLQAYICWVGLLVGGWYQWRKYKRALDSGA